jgi:hypothetical protein
MLVANPAEGGPFLVVSNVERKEKKEPPVWGWRFLFFGRLRCGLQPVEQTTGGVPVYSLARQRGGRRLGPLPDLAPAL